MRDYPWGNEDRKIRNVSKDIDLDEIHSMRHELIDLIGKWTERGMNVPDILITLVTESQYMQKVFGIAEHDDTIESVVMVGVKDGNTAFNKLGPIWDDKEVYVGPGEDFMDALRAAARRYTK